MQLISHGLYSYGVIALPSMAASLSLGGPVQSRRVHMRRARRTGLSVVFRHGPRRSSRWESNARARGYTMRRSKPKVLVLQVNGLVDDSAAPLPRRPIFGRSAGDRPKSGRHRRGCGGGV